MSFKIDCSTISVNNMLSTAVRESLSSVYNNSVAGVVFYGYSDKIDYHSLLQELKQSVESSLGFAVPVTLVPQHLLPSGSLQMDIYTTNGCTDITRGKVGGVCYGKIDSSTESLLFIEGIAASDFTDNVERQSREVFSKLEATLSAHNFTAENIVRQWNYIGDIVGSRDGKQNYQEFNDARTEYYSRSLWSYGYPAATGIGSEGSGIVVGAIAYKRGDNGGIYPIDNPLQVAAHIYSKDVLIDSRANAVKSTPKFERAKIIETERGACCFVSGTAAIRGEQSIVGTTAAEQTRLTIENIAHLVSKENLVKHNCKPYELKYTQLQVFIKCKDDYLSVKEVVESYYNDVATVYTVADVCRSELLVEIEGILISQ